MLLKVKKHIMALFIFRSLGIFASLGMLISLGACASPKFAAEVVRFHDFSHDTQSIGNNQSVSIIPARPELEGLEFAGYANLIGAKMADLGFRPVQEGESADFIALVDYMNMPHSVVDDRRDSPFSVGVGVGGVGSHVGVNVGTVFGVGDKAEDKVFARSLTLRLKSPDSRLAIFEGRVTSQGREGSLAQIMPNMVDALFSGFPGPSGTTTYFEEKITHN